MSGAYALSRIGIVVFLLCTNQVIAQTIESVPDGTTSWKAGADGVTLDFRPDGTIKRIYSKESHPVTFDDKRGIKTASIIAEEKAKGEIVRFMRQDVASGRAVSELEATLSKTTQTSNGEQKSNLKIDERAVVESVKQFSSSFSSGTLQGVVVLEQGYDEKEKEAWVVVGLSEKTIAASKATREMLAPTDDVKNTPGAVLPSGASDNAKAGASKGYTRKGNQDF
ncbi:hypothetical protein [Methylobacterium sp. WCS2018Hpa-22]|uniref:hypothetical protein n=1 Tax=Methylobacterium sp. WCS2018Hpa-22 TaxID=3073633 RepID=UPI00288B6843|nr:hypothetical protein [Methylobacterium sp. WCS2018Hpa-22]